jgi:hypothetical protein
VLQLTEQRTAIEADIAEMQVNAAAFVKKGARIKPTTCGGRLCVAVSTDQGAVSVDFTPAWHAPGQDAIGDSEVVLMRLHATLSGGFSKRCQRPIAWCLPSRARAIDSTWW